MKAQLFKLLLAALAVTGICGCRSDSYWSAEGTGFVREGENGYFIGTNLWYAARLAASPDGRKRLSEELDILKDLGVTNLRVLAVEGENLDHLEYALDQMQRRDMCAVLFLNNAWEWSYGYGDYLEAAGRGPQPKPAEDGYAAYVEAMSAFCSDTAAVALNRAYVRRVVERFRNHPAIFSWQICNEPRCFSDDPAKRDAFVQYVHSTAALIKSLDGNHMVSTGNEGRLGCEDDMLLCERINDCPDIDYITIHIWPYNWSWVREDSVNDGVAGAVAKVNDYIDSHIALAASLGKPLVIEEFGYPRDGFSFSTESATEGRDRIYACVFSRVLASARRGGPLAGCNFWGWGGLAQPGHIYWQEGDDLCGDPSQEQQGLNSVFVSDSSTVALIREAASSLGTASLYDFLHLSAASGTPLFGHQDDLMYGHSWNATKENDSTLMRSDVLSVAGSYPFVLGLDLGGLEVDSPVNLDGNDFDLMRLSAIRHHERGGVVTISWHLRNPLTGGDAWDVSDSRTVESILPGGSHHEKFIGWLDRVSDFIASLKDESGKQIPIIWRPWHEHTGGWFWWGDGLCTPEQFNSLWRMTYDYMQNERKLEGLLWAISPNSIGGDFSRWEERYPGDGYVDIAGLDCYCSTYVPMEQALPQYVDDMRRCLQSLSIFAKEHHKILALTETGYEGLTYGQWWTEAFAPAMEGFPLAYALVWRNTDEMPRGMTHFYAPWSGGPSERDFVEAVDNGIMRLLK